MRPPPTLSTAKNLDRAGINVNLEGINGLTEALEANNGVSTNYR